jgi:hypothetical protein
MTLMALEVSSRSYSYSTALKALATAAAVAFGLPARSTDTALIGSDWHMLMGEPTSSSSLCQ